MQKNNKVSLTIIGFTNLEILGKKTTLKIYKTKQGANIAAAELMINAKIKAAKQFVDDFANILRAEALKTKFWAAKKMLRIYRWSFKNYCNLLSCVKNVRVFNSSMTFDLRIKL